MSTRTTLRPYVVINAQSMASNITSSVTVLESITAVSYQMTWSGTSPVGTVSVQMSDDYSLNVDGTVKNAGTWSTIYINVNGTPATTAAVSGNTGSGFIDIEKTAAYAIRLIYTAGSGTGTMTATICGKVA